MKLISLATTLQPLAKCKAGKIEIKTILTFDGVNMRG
jgi:hypothetical protein